MDANINTEFGYAALLIFSVLVLTQGVVGSSDGPYVAPAISGYAVALPALAMAFLMSRMASRFPSKRLQSQYETAVAGVGVVGWIAGTASFLLHLSTIAGLMFCFSLLFCLLAFGHYLKAGGAFGRPAPRKE